MQEDIRKVQIVFKNDTIFSLSRRECGLVATGNVRSKDFDDFVISNLPSILEVISEKALGGVVTKAITPVEEKQEEKTLYNVFTKEQRDILKTTLKPHKLSEIRFDEPKEDVACLVLSDIGRKDYVCANLGGFDKDTKQYYFAPVHDGAFCGKVTLDKGKVMGYIVLGNKKN